MSEQKTIYDYDWSRLEKREPPNWAGGVKYALLGLLAGGLVTAVLGAWWAADPTLPLWIVAWWWSLPAYFFGTLAYEAVTLHRKACAEGYDVIVESLMSSARRKTPWPRWRMRGQVVLGAAGCAVAAAAVLLAGLSLWFLCLLGPGLVAAFVAWENATTYWDRKKVMRRHPDRLPPLLAEAIEVVWADEEECEDE